MAGKSDVDDGRGGDPVQAGAYGGGDIQRVDLDYWDDDGSEDFSTLWERSASGPVS